MKWLLLIMMPVLCLAEPADYILRRQKVVELQRSGDWEAALAASHSLREVATSEVQEADALEQAAMAALRLKEQDLAFELAGQIPLETTRQTVHMRLLMATRQAETLLKIYGDADLASWPDWLAGEAYHLRAEALLSRDQQAAQENYQQALRYLTHYRERAAVQLRLAELAGQQDDQSGQALQRYQQVMKELGHRRGHQYYRAAIRAADLLRQQGELVAAETILDRVPWDSHEGYWRSALLLAHARLWIAQDQTAEARRLLQALMKQEDLLEVHQQEGEALLQTLAEEPAP